MGGKSVMRRGLAVLVVAALAWGLPATQPAQAVTFTESMEIDDSVLADGFDYLGVWNGSSWLYVSYTLGTMPDPTPGNPTASGDVGTTVSVSGVTQSGLTFKKKTCIDYTKKLKGRHCFLKYRVTNDNDPSADYILWWTYGSTASNALPTVLTGVKDTVRTTSTNVSLLDWRPTGTTQAGSCVTKNMNFGLSAWGISASIGQSFTVCPERFGPDTVSTKAFRYRWDGHRAPNDWVGMAGGALFQVPPGGSGAYLLGTVGFYCEIFGDPAC